MQEPSRIWWARPRKLCGMERPGGGGRSHRPERRAAEIEYLKRARRAARGLDDALRATTWAPTRTPGSPWHHVPVESAQRGADALEELLPLLRRELRRRGRGGGARRPHTDFVAAVCAAHLHEARGVDAGGGAGAGGGGRADGERRRRARCWGWSCRTWMLWCGQAADEPLTTAENQVREGVR